MPTQMNEWAKGCLHRTPVIRQMNSFDIQKALAPLIRLPLRSIGRAANMLWVELGEMRAVSTIKRESRMVGDWAIHIQCPWRICGNGRILIASHDFYCTPAGDPLDDWDVVGSSLFDAAASVLNKEFELAPPIVTSVQPDDVGGFLLDFGDQHRLEAFPDNSAMTIEAWRVFQPGADAERFVYPSTA